MNATWYIGWDVGGWNCDTNGKSRDAVAILSPDREIVGTPWRGNLTKTINESRSTGDFIARIFSLCRAKEAADRLVLGIDTPPGFSDEFLNLVSRRTAVDSPTAPSRGRTRPAGASGMSTAKSPLGWAKAREC